MNYTIPHYITNQGQPSPVLDYVWDSTRGSLDFQYDAENLIDKMESATIRAKISLCIGVYEWVIWRYHRLSDDLRPFQIAEAAWCGNIKSAYIVAYELDHDEFCPVSGILFDAMVSIGTVLNYTAEDPREWRNELAYLVAMAMHVLPDTKPFENWLETITDRLLILYPAPIDDPYEDIFNDHEEERRGPIVAREALDPSFDYHPEQAPMLLEQFLRGVDYTKNPFLRSPEELIKAGFCGTPYTI